MGELGVTSDGIRSWSVARDTPTQRVAVSVGRALSVGAAWCGVAGILGAASREVSRASAQPVVEDDRRPRELSRREAAVHRAPPGDVSCHTGADRVTLVVDCTVSGLSAGRGVTGRARVLEVPVIPGPSDRKLVSLPLGGYEVLTASRG